MSSSPAQTDHTTLRIARLDAGELVLDGLTLARTFFSVDPSSVGLGAYDSSAGRAGVGAIETRDVVALNTAARRARAWAGASFT